MSTTDHKVELDSIRRELLRLRIKKAHGDLRDTSQFRKLRRKAAKLLTLMNS